MRVYNGTGYKVVNGYFTTASLMDFLSFAVSLCTTYGASQREYLLQQFYTLYDPSAPAPPVPKVKDCSSLSNSESSSNLNSDFLGSSFKPVPFISCHIANHSIGVVTK